MIPSVFLLSLPTSLLLSRPVGLEHPELSFKHMLHGGRQRRLAVPGHGHHRVRWARNGRAARRRAAAAAAAATRDARAARLPPRTPLAAPLSSASSSSSCCPSSSSSSSAAAASPCAAPTASRRSSSCSRAATRRSSPTASSSRPTRSSCSLTTTRRVARRCRPKSNVLRARDHPLFLFFFENRFGPGSLAAFCDFVPFSQSAPCFLQGCALPTPQSES
jgi:hypothetical protein